MKLLRAPILLTVGFILMAGCSSAPDYHQEHYASRFKQYGYGFTPSQNNNAPEHASKGKLDATILKRYTDRIAFELSKQIQPESLATLAVVSFVDFDDSLNTTHAFGNKIAEDLSVSLKQQGFNVTELNTAAHVERNEQGSFVFVRQPLNIKVPFVTSGIIQYTDNAAVLNVRVIDMTSRQIIAAYSQIVPNFIVRNAFPVNDGQDIILKG